MEFTFEMIVNLLLAIAPALTSILGIILAVVKLIKTNKDNNADIVAEVQKIAEAHDEEIRVLRVTCNTLMQQNAELKRQQQRIIAKALHVNEGEGQNGVTKN